MKPRQKTVLGVDAPPPRPTVLAALLVALCVSLPAGAVLAVLDWLVLK